GGKGVRGVTTNTPYVLATLPAAIILALFFLAPALWAVYISLTDKALLRLDGGSTQFIGLDNYRALADIADFRKFVWNTVVFVAGSAVVGQTGLGLALALLLHHATGRGYRLSSLAYAAVLVAWISPPVFAGSVWGGIFEYRHGLLNTALGKVGLGPVDMLGQYPMLSVIIADVWRGTAFAMVIFLGALQTVPRTIYEAARVDGAGIWHRFWDQTLPSLRHVVALVLLTTTLVTMGSFLLILILTNGDPGYQTETIALFAFHRAFGQYEIGFGAAISVVMLAMNLLFAALYLRLARVKS
ncbi:MAG: multiple sugar transport system permease protein, partial [Thermomicrobiales bacterium]|nr:multiple sugar transport system permease protein [Thermomicrobiales bacterium]